MSDPPDRNPEVGDRSLEARQRNEARRRQAELDSDDRKPPESPSSPDQQARYETERLAREAVVTASLRILPYDSASRQATEIANLGLEVLRQTSRRFVRLETVVAGTGATIQIGLYRFGGPVVKTCRYNGQNMFTFTGRRGRTWRGRGPTPATVVEFIKQRSTIISAVDAEKQRIMDAGAKRRRRGRRDSLGL